MTDQRADKVSCLPATAPLCHQHILHQAVSRYSPYTLKARNTPSDGNPAWVSARNAFPPARARRGKPKHQAGGLSHPVRLLNISRCFLSGLGMLQCHHLRDTFSFPLAHKPTPPDTRKEASSDSVNTIPNVKPHVHQLAPEKRALSTVRHTFKHPKPPADSFPSVPKNMVTRQPTRKRSGLLAAKEESTKLLHLFLTAFLLQSLMEKLRLPATNHISSNKLCT